MQTPSRTPSHLPKPQDDLPLTPSDDDVDLSEEDTDTVDDLPIATDRHPHVNERELEEGPGRAERHHVRRIDS
jgi:hypothetical protein